VLRASPFFGVDVRIPMEYDHLNCPFIQCYIENPGITRRASFTFETASVEFPIRYETNQVVCVLDENGDCAIRLSGAVSSQPTNALRSLVSEGRMSAGIGSELFNQHPSFMLIPPIDTEYGQGSLILPAERPSDYCADSSIGYANYTNTGNGKYKFRMSMSVVGESGNPVGESESGDFAPYIINTSYSGLRLGVADMERIVEGMHRTSFVQMEQMRGFWGMRDGCTDAVIDSFPDIRFAIGSEESVSVQIILGPRDYIVIDSGSSGCRLNIYMKENENHKYIGQTVLRHTAVHFDGLNQRIGFCEPV